MSFRNLLETYPLYKNLELPEKEKYLDSISDTHSSIPSDSLAVTMNCEVCNSDQTFERISDLNERYSVVLPIDDFQIVRLIYKCVSCRNFFRFFLVKFDREINSAMKVGQEPRYDTKMNPNIKKSLGKHTGFYSKALSSEEHGYGIGAFAYFRRVLDDLIDSLLKDIAELIEGEEEKARYAEALKKVKSSTVTKDKINLVKDLLPPILRPGGINPLDQLHEVLSEGIHKKTDEECLVLAERIKKSLVFLVKQVSISRASANEFTEYMKSFLNKK